MNSELSKDISEDEEDNGDYINEVYDDEVYDDENNIKEVYDDENNNDYLDYIDYPSSDDEYHSKEYHLNEYHSNECYYSSTDECDLTDYSN